MVPAPGRAPGGGADLRLADAVVVPGQILSGLATAHLRDLAASLYAVEAAAVAGWCARTAAQHARTRYQFGRPIGSFQAIKHLCAEMLCRTERAAALAWDAARALDDAVDNAKDCIQVLGGLGFTWEHDAHLYLRRAMALRQLLGGSAAWRARAGQLALAGARRRLRLSAASAATQPAAAAARAVAAEVAALPGHCRRAALA